MNPRRFLLALLLLGVLGGCSIRFTGSSSGKDGGIFRSTDFGETWEQKSFIRQEERRTVTISDVSVASLQFSPKDDTELTLTTFRNGVYRSSNAGESWTQLTLGNGYYPTFAYDPTNTTLQYTATGPRILKSVNSGETWEIIYIESRGEAITAVLVDRFDPTKILASTSGGTVLQSKNSGTDWSLLTSVRDTVRTLQPDPIDSRIVYAITAASGILKTLDGGSTWAPLSSLASYPGATVIHQLLLRPTASGMLFAATDYGILKSVDGGATWEPQQTLIPFGAIPIRTIGIDPQDSTIMYFTVNNLLHKSEDEGTTWKTIGTIPTARLVTRLLVHPSESGLLFLGTFQPQQK